MSLDLAILGFLNENPSTGYDLKNRCFRGPLSAFWSADQAQIYRTLDRLQTERLVTSKRRKQPGRPDRKTYEITPEGRNKLRSELRADSLLPPLRDSFLVQVYFAGQLDDQDLVSVLQSERDQHQAKLDALHEHSASIEAQHRFPPRQAILRQTALDGAMVHHRAYIDWLNDCIDALEHGVLPGSAHEGHEDRQLSNG